jgi:uncharacterized protein YceK
VDVIKSVVAIGRHSVLLLALGVIAAGCSSMQVRTTDQYRRRPHLYPATADHDSLGTRPLREFARDLPPVLDLDLWGNGLSFHPETLVLGPAAYLVGAACYIAVDRPVAMVSDTVLLPYDGYRVSRFNTVTQFWGRVVRHGDGLPLPTCAELTEHHYVPYVRPMLGEYLDRDEVSRPLLKRLVEAGIGTIAIAGSSHVDAELGERLVSAPCDAIEACVELSGNTSAPPAILERVFDRTRQPSVLRNLAANPAVPSRLFQQLLACTNDAAIVRAVAGNPRAPSEILKELPLEHAATIARNPNASVGVLHHLLDGAPAEHAAIEVVQNPAADGAILAKAAEQYAGSLRVRRLVAEHPNTPATVLWGFAREQEPALGGGLVRNPNLPPDLVVYLAQWDQADIQRQLAERSSMPLNVQSMLVDSAHVAVRHTLARNTTTAPDVLQELARTETDDDVLFILASRTNVPERVHLALAARRNQAALRALARNPAASDVVLRQILENADDATARVLLTIPHATYTTRKSAWDAIGDKEWSARMGPVQLERNTIIDGIAFAAGTEVGFHPDGRVRYGTLAVDQELDGHRLDDVRFRQGRRILLDRSGKVETRPPLPTSIQGLPCAEKAFGYNSGRLRNTVLAEAHTIQGLAFPAGTAIGLHESGKLQHCILPIVTVIRDVPCSSEKPVSVYESGGIRIAQVGREFRFDGVVFGEGEEIRFLESGELDREAMAADHTRRARHMRGASRFEEAVRECDRALALRPDLPAALAERGFARLGLDRPDAALEDLRRAAELAPDQAHTHYGLGLCHYRRGEWARAIEAYSEAIDCGGPAVDLLQHRAQCRLAERDFSGARADFARAVELAPASSPPANNLAWLLATCPDPAWRDGERALTLAKELVERDRTGPYLDTLAAAYAELGRFGKAVKAQEQAIAAVEGDERKELLPQFRDRLESYRKKRPWRE